MRGFLILTSFALIATCANAADLRGVWRWNCCGGQHAGTFEIESQNADGTFSGRFGNTASDGKSPLSGKITGNRIEFKRTILPERQTQTWTAQLSASGDSLKMANGHWSGFGYSGGSNAFSAERIHAAEESAVSLIGRWNWVCCSRTHQGTLTVTEHDAQGRIRGVFGKGPSEGSSPFEGTFRNGEWVFTRHLTIQGARQQQVWKSKVVRSGGTMKTTGGQWSGFSAAPGYTDFEAVFAGR